MCHTVDASSCLRGKVSVGEGAEYVAPSHLVPGKFGLVVIPARRASLKYLTDCLDAPVGMNSALALSESNAFAWPRLLA